MEQNCVTVFGQLMLCNGHHGDVSLCSASCSKDTLHQVASHLHLADPTTPHLPTEQLVELLAYKHERRVSQMDQLNSMPIYPTEEVGCTHRHTNAPTLL